MNQILEALDLPNMTAFIGVCGFMLIVVAVLVSLTYITFSDSREMRRDMPVAWWSCVAFVCLLIASWVLFLIGNLMGDGQ